MIQFTNLVRFTHKSRSILYEIENIQHATNEQYQSNNLNIALTYYRRRLISAGVAYYGLKPDTHFGAKLCKIFQ